MDKISIDDLTREQWVKFEWIDVTTLGDKTTMLIRGHERTPDKGAEAAEQWDIWHSAIGVMP